MQNDQVFGRFRIVYALTFPVVNPIGNLPPKSQDASRTQLSQELSLVATIYSERTFNPVSLLYEECHMVITLSTLAW